MDFYPSISEDLLLNALDYASRFTTITQQDRHIFIHAKKSLLYHQNSPWTKKNTNDMFDVTTGSYDGTEMCELIGAYMLSLITSKFKDEVGLYRWSCSLQSHPVRNRKKPRNKSAMYLNQTINCPLPASTPRQRKWIWSQTNMQSRAHSERKKRDITWYNHPFNSNVKTNLGKSSSISSINASRKTVSIRFSTDTLSN